MANVLCLLISFDIIGVVNALVRYNGKVISPQNCEPRCNSTATFVVISAPGNA